MKTHEFKFHNLSIRAVEIDGEPWFVAKDVFEALGYPKGSRTYHLKELWADEVGVSKIKTPRGEQSMKRVNEPGLYRLVLKSDRPDAKAFQDWVTRTVLPAIRKDGGYIRGEELVSTGVLSEDELVTWTIGPEVSGLRPEPKRYSYSRDTNLMPLGYP